MICYSPSYKQYSHYIGYSLQKSLSKEEDIKRKYEKEFHRSQAEKIALTNQLEAALQERNKCVRERNEVIQERNSLALQVQQEYERAERQVFV